MMKLVRFVLGKIILTLDAIFRPAGVTRELALQSKFDAETKDWRLYQLVACPFCVKVRRELARLSITIPLKDIGSDESAHAELMKGGKEDQVPCLMIPKADGSVQWMYESSEIVSFLRSRFTSAQV